MISPFTIRSSTTQSAPSLINANHLPSGEGLAPLQKLPLTKYWIGIPSQKPRSVIHTI